jgi:DNA-directed RNA polymerase specialized sigma24 family protein
VQEETAYRQATAATLNSPRRRLSKEGESQAWATRHKDAELLERIRAEHAQRWQPASVLPRRSPLAAPDAAGPRSAVTSPRPCPEYEVLANRLCGCAVRLLKSLLRTGRIKEELLHRGLPVGLANDDYERLHTSMAARDALAITIVIAGEEYFRRTVIPRMKWYPDGGASLETFFVNGCLLHFASSVRSWRKEHPEWFLTPGPGTLSCQAPDTAPDPQADAMMEAVENRDLINRLTALAPPMVKAIMLLMLEGFSFAEIGDHLGISERAVEGRLHRFRATVKKDARRGLLYLPPAFSTPGAA